MPVPKAVRGTMVASRIALVGRVVGDIMKKLIVFDLDGSLAQSKSSIDIEMSSIARKLFGLDTIEPKL